jgi:hypothetical protein
MVLLLFLGFGFGFALITSSLYLYRLHLSWLGHTLPTWTRTRPLLTLHALRTLPTYLSTLCS